MEDDLKELLRYLMDSGTGMACDERMVYLLLMRAQRLRYMKRLKYGAKVKCEYWNRTPLERSVFYSRYVRTKGEYTEIIRMLEEAEAKLRSNQTEKK